MAPQNNSNEIAITRMYDAAVEDVWDAWTDPAQVAQWWGPRGFSLTTHSKDLRPGGTWRYTMHGPDGTDYPNITTYFEVEKHAKLVYDHGASDDRPPLFRVTVRFSAVGARTKMEMTMTLPTPESAKETRRFIKDAGGNGTWDRLAEYLKKSTTGMEIFVINRSVAAPIAVVFDMWMEPKHLSQWLPPPGLEMTFMESEIRVGGCTRYSMSGNGISFHGRVEYLAIEKPHRIVSLQQFCDEHGAIARHPFAPTWPETMRRIVELTEEGPEQTRVTVTWEAHGDTTSEELAKFVEERGGMTKGWTNSFDKLDALLGVHD